MALLRILGLTVVLALAVGMAQAQEVPRGAITMPSPVLTLDPERVYTGSLWGKRVAAQINSELAALAAENEGIADELTLEERDLTERRATMPAEEFRTAADAFDAKVTEIRRRQDAKSRDIARRADAEKLGYYQALFTPLSEVLKARGAVAILDRAAIFLAVDAIDVTDEVIARADALLGAGPATPLPEAAPEPTAPTAPADGN
ncbi:OmpH family outer membrane protein [Phaeovulum sp.]|uniref:OmpH family outer membrane protein n=1 Tax=Phaeovulum sp. TaxID=2934796 RepID=UPI002731A879|nr:OmpH family outer membrane protein [Phaeovulum sp.]MDP1670212.1 OmpH family outer membrane protein [Phaeovulum sp.]MDZ4120292.1 OmpH family outer membrane protein [Phaeovulum sp.]